MAFTLKATKTGVGRTEILDEMYETLTNPKVNMGYALYGRRRVGKTSVFLKLQERLRKSKDVVTVYISVWDLVEGTLEEFSLKLADLILEEYRPRLGISQKLSDLKKIPTDMARKILSEKKIGIGLSENIEFFIMHQQDKKKKSAELLEAVFELAEKSAKKTKTKCILLIDEFPSLVELKTNGSKAEEQILRKIRSINELQENTVICISGSLKHTMDLTLFASTSAFYRQLIPKKIEPLENKYITQIISQELGKERVTEGAFELISEFTQGIPYYAQALGRELERYKGKITETQVKEAINNFLKNTGDILSSNELKQLSPKERVIVVALATKDIHHYSEIQRELSDEVSNIGTFLATLEEKGIVEKTEDSGYLIVDPIFRMWLEKKYGE